MENEKITDYGGVFYRIENVVTYLLLVVYLIFVLSFYIVSSVKQGDWDNTIFLFIVSIVRPVPSLTVVASLFFYVSILILLGFFIETKKDYLKLKQLVNKKRFVRKLKVEHDALEKRKIMLIPFYETVFLPRYRENPVLKFMYTFHPGVYILAIIYILVIMPALIVEYWEGRVIEIITLTYFFFFRAISRIASLLILSKITTGKFSSFMYFREIVVKVKGHKKVLFMITKERE